MTKKVKKTEIKRAKATKVAHRASARYGADAFFDDVDRLIAGVVDLYKKSGMQKKLERATDSDLMEIIAAMKALQKAGVSDPALRSLIDQFLAEMERNGVLAKVQVRLQSKAAKRARKGARR